MKPYEVSIVYPFRCMKSEKRGKYKYSTVEFWSGAGLFVFIEFERENRLFSSAAVQITQIRQLKKGLMAGRQREIANL